MRYNYNGLLVCPRDYEERHPQEIAHELRPERMLPTKVSPRLAAIYRLVDGLPIVLDWIIES